MNDIFGPGSNVSVRYVKEYDELEERVRACKTLGMKIALVSGTWDLLHVGHCRYFEKAKESASPHINDNVLIVGVDSDAKVKSRKGENRPIVPQEERVEMICNIRHVDLAIIKEIADPKWKLIKTVKPDVLVISERNKYTQEEREQLKEWCGRLIVLESQATTSTTAKIRLLLVGMAQDMKKNFDALRQRMYEEFDNFSEMLDKLIGGGAR